MGFPKNLNESRHISNPVPETHLSSALLLTRCVLIGVSENYVTPLESLLSEGKNGHFCPEKLLFHRQRHRFCMCRFRFKQHTSHSGTIFLFWTLSPGNGPMLFFALEQLPAAAFGFHEKYYEIAICIQFLGMKRPYLLCSQNVGFGSKIIGAAGAVFPFFSF